ncbi:hypothetical protein A2U01_0081895, partial [Trifolium medium]|nr:hypothetical protein [Trifolium medium]
EQWQTDSGDQNGGEQTKAVIRTAVDRCWVGHKGK